MSDSDDPKTTMSKVECTMSQSSPLQVAAETQSFAFESTTNADVAMHDVNTSKFLQKPNTVDHTQHASMTPNLSNGMESSMHSSESPSTPPSVGSVNSPSRTFESCSSSSDLREVDDLPSKPPVDPHSKPKSYCHKVFHDAFLPKRSSKTNHSSQKSIRHAETHSQHRTSRKRPYNDRFRKISEQTQDEENNTEIRSVSPTVILKVGSQELQPEQLLRSPKTNSKDRNSEGTKGNESLEAMPVRRSSDQGSDRQTSCSANRDGQTIDMGSVKESTRESIEMQDEEKQAVKKQRLNGPTHVVLSDAEENGSASSSTNEASREGQVVETGIEKGNNVQSATNSSTRKDNVKKPLSNISKSASEIKAQRATLKRMRARLEEAKRKKLEMEDKLQQTREAAASTVPRSRSNFLCPITALTSSLIISNISQTGPEEMVRFPSETLTLESGDVGNRVKEEVSPSVDALAARKSQLQQDLDTLKQKLDRKQKAVERKQSQENKLTEEKHEQSSSTDNTDDAKKSMNKQELERRRDEVQTQREVSYLKHFVSKQEHLLSEVRTKVVENAEALEECNNQLVETDAVVQQVDGQISDLETRHHAVTDMLLKNSNKLIETRNRLHEAKEKKVLFERTTGDSSEQFTDSIDDKTIELVNRRQPLAVSTRPDKFVDQ